jgi:hypothetical protein
MQMHMILIQTKSLEDKENLQYFGHLQSFSFGLVECTGAYFSIYSLVNESITN